MKALFKQFSFWRYPGSRRARDTGLIHEGGEIGYALSPAYGAAFDQPNLIVAWGKDFSHRLSAFSSNQMGADLPACLRWEEGRCREN